MAVIDTPSGKMTVRDEPSGYEVKTPYGGVSTRTPEAYGVPRGIAKPVFVSGGGGGGVPSTSSSQAEQQKEQQRQEIEAARLKAIQDARQQYAINIRNAQGVQGKLQQMQQLNLATARANLEASQRNRELGAETAARAVSHYASELQQLRKAAGTYGKDLGRAAELGALMKYQQTQKVNYDEAIAQALREGKKVEYTDTGVIISNIPKEYEKSLQKGAATPGQIAIQETKAKLESYSQPIPFNVISAAPSQWEVYKDFIKDRPVTGTLGYVLEKAKGFGTQIGLGKEGKYGKFMPLAEAYQAEPTGNLFQLGAGAAIFSVPYVGSVALTGMGIESIATKSGREEIQQTSTTLQEKKVPKTVANVLAWGIPIAEIGLGTSRIWYPRLKGYIQTRGRTKIPTEEIVPKSVLLGGKSFPTAGESLTSQQRARLHLELFKKGEYRLPGYAKPGGYHATPDIFWGGTTTTQPGSSEFPGLYTSYSASPYFLKISKGGYPKDIVDLFYGDILTPSGKPGVMYVTPTGFRTGKTAKPGYAFVPGVKSEVEAIIPPATELTKAAKQYYFTWKGVRVPIDEFAVAGATTGATGTYSGLVSSYSGLPSTTTSLSSKFFLGSLISSLGIEPSSKKYTSSSVSGSSLIAPSKVSYAKSSVKPSYKISYGTSGVSKPMLSPAISPSSSLSSAIYKLTTSYMKPVSYKPYPQLYKPYKPKPYTPYYPPPKRRTEYKPSILSSALGKLTEGFEVFGKRFGKWKKISPDIFGLEKTEALSLGKGWAEQSLGATFKLLKTTKPVKRMGYKTDLGDLLFKFQEYRILKGQKIKTPLEFIQKPQYRLSHRQEVSEIQRARKKQKKIKWL